MVASRTRAVVALAAAWAVTTAVAVVAVARAGGSIGDAILAPLWVATGVGLLVYPEDARRSLLAAAVMIVVAGLARGYALLAGLGVVRPLPTIDTFADAAVFLAVLLSFYDIWAERRSRGQEG